MTVYIVVVVTAMVGFVIGYLVRERNAQQSIADHTKHVLSLNHNLIDAQKTIADLKNKLRDAERRF